MNTPRRFPPFPVSPVLWGEERERRLEKIARLIEESEAAK